MSKHKVVYNSCYGGFSLSEKAQEWFEQHGHPSWAEYSPDIPRHHPLLVQCVEELRDEASGKYARLRIAEIKGNKYWIEEYDGQEWVHTPENTDWVIIEDEEDV